MRSRVSKLSACAVLFSLAVGGTAPLWGQAVKYDSMGKRDPFLNLLQVTQRPEPPRFPAPPPLEQRPPGLAGLLIAEVTVTGIAQGVGSRIALLKGIDGATYFAKEGTKLFDGYVESISTDAVVFVREQVDTRGRKKVTKVHKELQIENR
ncbi:MAG: hypothetical protein Kow00109_06840 [Acidobacteriota bacterium]